MITKGADHYWGLYYACQGGHKEPMELMIAKGNNNWNYGLQGACQGDHKELVELMIAKSANRCYCGKAIKDH